MTIALSHGGTTIHSSPSRSQEVWVGTQKGIAVLERDAGGNGWRLARHMLEDKHISAIHQEPGSGMFFAGAFHGGLHASADHGATWEARDNGLTSNDVYSVASSRNNGGHPAVLPAPSRRTCSAAMTWAGIGPSCRRCGRCPACPTGVFRRRLTSPTPSTSTSIPTIPTPCT